ncbi:hypothetical protein AB0A63_16110 [Lentzea sp. NPDC042327]|uniref:DUF7779 domain-containing protein n=1 Tax=Lentzea sp. NPDC042327 TaxID=3154801 RepID=UPI00340ED1F6
MPDEDRPANSVTGVVHGPVVQVSGDVNGGVHLHPPTAEVAFPIRVGVIPRQADCYQDRLTDAPLTTGLTTLTGTSGVGKTQTAAHHARASDADVVVWVSATTREAILNTYAAAAACLRLVTSGTDVVPAAEEFLSWLQTANRTWLVVLDDVVDPAAVRGLWPPGSGQTLVTTQRRDSAVRRADSRVVDVHTFSAADSSSYLAAKLAAHPDLRTGAEDLADALGHLPLALAQAVAYLVDRGLTCAEYLSRFRSRRLDALAPEPSALPDDHRATVAVTWSLAVELANSLTPQGLAEPLLQLASLLDPHGIPTTVLTGEAAVFWLEEATGRPVGPDDAADALHCLHRLSLVDLNAADRVVTLHPLVQRVARDDVPLRTRSTLAWMAAHAVHQALQQQGNDLSLASPLHANASAVILVALPALVTSSGCHPLLFDQGEALRAAGLVDDMHEYYGLLLELASRRLGAGHRQVLMIRNNNAGGENAVADLTRLLQDCLRLVGQNDELTLSVRNNLARARASSGEVGASISELEELVADSRRTLGESHRGTMRSRHGLAASRAAAGDPAAAIAELESLAADQHRVLGADDRDTLLSRISLARCRALTGDGPRAIAELEELAEQCANALGTDHSRTLLANEVLARCRTELT